MQILIPDYKSLELILLGRNFCKGYEDGNYERHSELKIFMSTF